MEVACGTLPGKHGKLLFYTTSVRPRATVSLMSGRQKRASFGDVTNSQRERQPLLNVASAYAAEDSFEAGAKNLKINFP